jgi:hypothetical protein
MLSIRRPITAGVALLMAVVPLVVQSRALGQPVPTTATTHTETATSDVARVWERILIRTVYTEGLSPVPVGVPYLGFTSLAMRDAAKTAYRQGDASPEAAVAVAAHDVLVAYFPASTSNLDADLETSLAALPDSTSKDRGITIGANAASDMVARRADDGRNDASIVYARDPAPGVWQPAPGGSMLAPWLGFVDLLVLPSRISVDGPNALTSRQYAKDFQEVKRTGAAVGADRTAFQTDTALFFNSNSAIMISEGLLRYLDEHPVSLSKTVRLFAVIHAAMTDSVITCWRLKYDVGFWRPSQAIVGAADDGNPATVADPGWTPLVPNPPYSDYVSGHACLTAPAVETIRKMLGEETALTLHSYNTNADRTYATLSEIEFDAFHARIWSGLHFRDAMKDGYHIGHEAAHRVLQLIH